MTLTAPEPTTIDPDTTTVSVVIPAHNAGATLGQQLQGLVDQAGAPAFEVIVVANRCTDDTVAVARRFRDQLDLQIVVADEKAGASYARNAGVEVASGGRVLFCDADDVVAPRWVAAILEALQTCDVVGGAVVAMDGASAWTVDHFGPPSQSDDLARWDGRVRFAISANLGCRRTVLEQTGGWDESLLHVEDLAFCARAQEVGFRLGVAPEAEVAYRPRGRVSEVLAQQINYAKGAARYQVMNEPEMLRPMPVQVLRMARHVGRIARPRADQDRLSELVHLASQTQRLRTEASLRREFGVASRETTAGMLKASIAARIPRVERSAMGSRWLRERRTKLATIDFTAPLSAPALGGKAFRAPLLIARDGAKMRIEPLLLQWIATNVATDSVVLDVGANIGYVTTAFAEAVGPGGAVHAFEPTPDTAAALQVNVRRHGVADSVTLHEVAVAEAAGRATLFCHSASVVNSLADGDMYRSGSVGTIEVDVVALDDVAPDRVDVIKVDVEGYETAVLRGARKTLATNPHAVLLLELNPASLAAAGSSVHEMLAELDLTNRRCSVLEDQNGGPYSGQVRPLDEVLVWLEAEPAQAERWYANLVVEAG